jgi:hypothetical protein
MAQPSSTTSRKPKPPNYDPYVRHAVTVEAGPEQAFEMFLQEFPAWWPHNLRCTKVGVEHTKFDRDGDPACETGPHRHGQGLADDPERVHGKGRRRRRQDALKSRRAARGRSDSD